MEHAPRRRSNTQRWDTERVLYYIHDDTMTLNEPCSLNAIVLCRRRLKSYIQCVCVCVCPLHLCTLLALECDRSPSRGTVTALQVFPLSSLEVTPCRKYTARSSRPTANTYGRQVD